MITQHHVPNALRKAAAIRVVIFLSLLMTLISPSVIYAAFPGTNGKIAFDSTRNGNEDIYVMNPDGSGVTQLTFDPAPDSYPEWSADGTKIVFQSARDGNEEIYVMNSDGSGQTNRTNDPNLDLIPTWSPDGTKIAFISLRDGNEEIYVMNADGTGQTNLTNHSAADAEPAWSPDGSKIAFDSTRNGLAQIYVMNADGTNVTQLTTVPRNGGPNWSPDGTKIAFHSDRDCGGCGTPFDIYVMNADGSGQTRLAFDPAYATGPGWSPDGTKIVFESQRDGNYEVYVMNADGTEQTNLTNDPAFDGRVDWGPVASVTVAFDAYLHGTGPNSNPPVLLLDNTAPSAGTAKYKDSSSVNFNGGNPWKDIGTWTGAPALSDGMLTTLSDLHVWLGLKNSDDQGTKFDLRAEVYNNGTLVTSNETYCITGITRNPNLAKEVTAAFGSFPPASFNGVSDTLTLKIKTRVGTNGSGGFCGGHSNAVGLRLYFDAVTQPSRFDVVFVQ